MSSNNSVNEEHKKDNKTKGKLRDVMRVITQIGKGSFGQVYKVKMKEIDEICACKVEPKKKKSRLLNEKRLYSRLKKYDVESVPNFIAYYSVKNKNLLVMELLGKSLDDIFTQYDKKMDVGSVMKVGIDIIKSLRDIHSAGIIHSDIKPNNFMFGRNGDSDKLFTLDFGLSKLWFQNKRHIEMKTGRSFTGTARYASHNIHLGIEPSRRDDLESVGYMLVYLAKGNLPWQGLKRKTKNDKEDKIDRIGEMKTTINLKKLCYGLPKCFYDFIKYTRNMDFDDTPDYNYLINIIKKSSEDNNIALEYPWIN